MKKKKKHRRLKKWVLPVLLILVIIPTSIILLNKNTNPNIINQKKYDIEEIVSKIDNEKIDTKFLEYIKDNFKEESIKQINEYLETSQYDDTIWHKVTGKSLKVLLDKYNNIYENATNVKEISSINNTSTLSFVGDISLADNWYIMPKYDERNKKVYGILSEQVVDIMTNSDIMVANSEFTISNRGTKMDGKYYTFRASPSRLSIYEEMGVDLVTLANNHVYDFGINAFNDMLDSLDEYNIPHIGAGKNIEEAKKPYYFIVNGYKIAFVNATRAEKLILTPEATETEPGVLRCYDTEMFENVIKEAKTNSDYVIALVHWGKEDSHQLEQVQEDTSKLYIDAGADVIVGSHAHVLQGIEYYNNKPIIYNLGDFIFNNETKDTGIFQIKLSNTGEMEYYFIPCYENEEYTKTLEGEEKQRVINEMISWSTNVSIDSYGKISPSN